MTSGEEEEAAPADGGGRGLEGQATRRRLQRTTTMLAYRKESLVDAQQHAAEVAVVAAATPRPSMAVPSTKGFKAPEAAAAAEAAQEAAAELEAANAWAVGGTCDRKFWSNPGEQSERSGVSGGQHGCMADHEICTACCTETWHPLLLLLLLASTCACCPTTLSTHFAAVPGCVCVAVCAWLCVCGTCRGRGVQGAGGHLPAGQEEDPRLAAHV